MGSNCFHVPRADVNHGETPIHFMGRFPIPFQGEGIMLAGGDVLKRDFLRVMSHNPLRRLPYLPVWVSVLRKLLPSNH